MTTKDTTKVLEEQLSSLTIDLSTIKQDIQTLHLRLSRMESQLEHAFTTKFNLESLPDNFEVFVTKLSKVNKQLNQLLALSQSEFTNKNTQKINLRLDKLLAHFEPQNNKQPTKA
jgi:predicted  nucleic acid-binding Zn-ribbon protein